MDDMSILQAAYKREHDPRDRRADGYKNWEYYAVGATREDIRRLEDSGYVALVVNQPHLKKYQLTKKGNDVVWSSNMEEKMAIIPAASVMESMNLIIGYDDLKEQLASAIERRLKVNFLLEGPPACAKSLMLEGVRSVTPEKNYMAFGSRTSAAGLSDALFEHQPEILLMDEADKMHNDCYSVLLGLMESGEIIETKSKKALRNGTLVYTPTGPRAIETLMLGDYVCTVDGNIARVVGVFPQGRQDIYGTVFSDGQVIPCTADHLWEIGRSNIKPKIVDTAELLSISPHLLSRTWVPVAGPVYFTSQRVPMDPYSLGVLLGDGGLTRETLNLSSQEETIRSRIAVAAPKGNSFKKTTGDNSTYALTRDGNRPKRHPWITVLRKLGLWGKHSYEKFIPEVYKYNSEKVRWGVVQGLMDTDGSEKAKYGQPCIETSSIRLADDLAEIVESLGGICSITVRQTSDLNKKTGQRVSCRPAYSVRITHPNAPKFFRLERKRALCSKKIKPMRRYIDNIRFIGQDEATCIKIDHPRQLFLTEGFVPTHNTRGIKLHTMVIAACNSSAKMPREFKSRFALHAQFPEYTRDEFIDVCCGFLSRAENCPPELATLIGSLIYDNQIGDVRKARGCWLLMNEATVEEVRRVISLMIKYSPDAPEVKQKKRQQMTMKLG